MEVREAVTVLVGRRRLEAAVVFVVVEAEVWVSAVVLAVLVVTVKI